VNVGEKVQAMVS